MPATTIGEGCWASLSAGRSSSRSTRSCDGRSSRDLADGGCGTSRSSWIPSRSRRCERSRPCDRSPAARNLPQHPAREHSPPPRGTGASGRSEVRHVRSAGRGQTSPTARRRPAWPSMMASSGGLRPRAARSVARSHVAQLVTPRADARAFLLRHRLCAARHAGRTPPAGTSKSAERRRSTCRGAGRCRR